jgi:hypothetical protein
MPRIAVLGALTRTRLLALSGGVNVLLLAALERTAG